MLRTLVSVIAIAALGSCAVQPRCAPVAADNVETAPSPANTLRELRRIAAENGSVRVIVGLAMDVDAPVGALGQRQETAQFIFASFDVGATPLAPGLPFLVAELTEEQLTDTLYYHGYFTSWTEDRVVGSSLSASAPLVQAPPLWELGGRGSGQTVAILDTGVDAAHNFLGGRVTSEACFSTTSAQSRSFCNGGAASDIGPGAAKPCSVAGCQHGTHVAGIAAGSGVRFNGIAPDANIMAVQVFSRFGQNASAFTSDIIRGLDFVLQQRNAGQLIAAVNLSLGGGRSRGFCDTEPTKLIVDRLRAAGVATVIASGNDGYRDSVSFPGCISTAITVGATDKSDRIASFSSCGPQTDLHAPGVSITSSVLNQRFSALSGTSMATPHVVGAFAALRSRHPRATVTQIEQALEATGRAGSGRPRIALIDADARLGAIP